ncbi:O-antigen ligase family protein [Bacteroides sp.]|uniref:O-antigen ligase family protein n=1 Tax=Bacteroides sp. TaxID=29523 RepID=UPI00262DAE34|nr:O-antigen ligase family protein [Bacteroides sp.]MDD3038316.1 O-antigen ligase family protein [Bacteroides sp.]
MQFVFLLFLLLGIWELGIGSWQCVNAFFNDWSYQTICGTFNNPGLYSVFIVMIIPVAWFYILRIKSFLVENYQYRLITVLSIVYVLLSFLVLPFSMSRTAWIAALVSCGIMTCIYIAMYKHFVIGKGTITVFICSLGIFVCFLYGLKKNSADGRLLIWKVSYSIIKENFVSGVGSGYFSSAYGDAQEKYFRDHKGTEHEKYIAGAPDFAYNEYLQIIVEYGIKGLLILIFVISYSFYNLSRINFQYRMPLIGMFISLLIVAFFSYPFRNIYTCLLSSCIIIIVMLFPTEKACLRNMILRSGFILFSLLVVFWKVCFSFGHLGSAKTAYEQWTLLKPYFDAEQYSEITHNYTALYPYLKSDAAFLFEYGQCLSNIKRYKESNLILQEGLKHSGDPMFLNVLGKNYQQLGKSQLAEQMFYKAYYRIPHKIYPLYLLMNLYKELHQEKDMLSIAYRILNQKNKINSLETEYVRNMVREELEKRSFLP